MGRGGGERGDEGERRLAVGGGRKGEVKAEVSQVAKQDEGPGKPDDVVKRGNSGRRGGQGIRNEKLDREGGQRAEGHVPCQKRIHISPDRARRAWLRAFHLLSRRVNIRLQKEGNVDAGRTFMAWIPRDELHS